MKRAVAKNTQGMVQYYGHLLSLTDRLIIRKYVLFFSHYSASILKSFSVKIPLLDDVDMFFCQLS